MHTNDRPRRARGRLGRRLGRSFALVPIALSIVACGDDSSAVEPERSYVLHLRAEDDEERYRFVAEDPVDVRVGDEVTFEVRNVGRLAHDFQVVDPDGRSVVTADPVNAGETISVTTFVDRSGAWQLRCTIDGHLLEHEMFAVIEVAEPDA